MHTNASFPRTLPGAIQVNLYTPQHSNTVHIPSHTYTYYTTCVQHHTYLPNAASHWVGVDALRAATQKSLESIESL